jgi:dihydrofolate synthase / folylpolyglutamate synthase
MKITAIKTVPITTGAPRLTDLVDMYLPALPNHSILAITSKVVSICESRTVPVAGTDKPALVKNEADYYLPPELNPYHVTTTIKSDILIASAGIDESNGDGHYILWPANPQATANQLRAHLAAGHHRTVAVIITDSHLTPMRRGTIGLGLAHSGFLALKNYVGTPDIFGHNLMYTYANHLDGLASAAVVAMGEGAECTPFALIEDASFIEFQDRDPTPEELAPLRIPLEEDLYSEMLKRIPWEKRPPRTH